MVDRTQLTHPVTQLDAVARRRPTAPALVADDGMQSYADLAARSARIASGLSAFGVRRGTRVGLLMGSHDDLVASVFAVWRLGAIVLLLNSQHGPDELRHPIKTTEPRIVLADAGRHLDAVAEVRGDGDLEEIATISRVLEHAGEPAPLENLDLDLDATIAFTSGTTGQAKGVTHTHRSLAIQLEMVLRHYRMRPDDRALSLLAISMLPNLLLGPLVALRAGASCRIMPRYDPEAFLEHVRRDGTTYVGPTVPTLYWDLLDRPATESDTGQLSTIRIAGCGGAPMPPDMRQRFEERYDFRFVHAYGTTEAPGLVATDPIGGPRKLASVGPSLAHIRLTVEDDDGTVMPPGEKGEICFSPQAEGPYAGLYEPMRCYWGMEDATREVLDGHKLRSGDTGHLDEDGFLYISDRKRDMITRGGSNIYPKELEDLLHADARIVEAAVVGAPHPRYGEVPVAFIRASDPGVSKDDVLTAVNGRTAAYKHLTDVHFVEQFPRNALGKILKRDLRQRLLS